jgi:magnesium transporter
MIRVLTKGDTGMLSLIEGVDAARAAIQQKGESRPRVWLDLTTPAPDEIDILRKDLLFGEFSIEDCLREDHPPKVEEIGEEGNRAAYLFLVARSPLAGAAGGYEGVALFVRPRLLVTVHMQDSARVNTAIERVIRDPKQTIGAGIEFAAHALLDELVEGFEPMIEAFEDEIEQLEEIVVTDFEKCSLRQVLQLRQRSTQLHREARPMRDIMASLAREGHPLIKPKARMAFRDLYDHIQRTLDRLENDRELIASLRDAHLALQNNRMNDVMKALTVVSVMSGAMAVVTGVFGMNLKFPMEDDGRGFMYTIIGMLILCVAIFAFFRWRRWV